MLIWLKTYGFLFLCFDLYIFGILQLTSLISFEDNIKIVNSPSGTRTTYLIFQYLLLILLMCFMHSLHPPVSYMISLKIIFNLSIKLQRPEEHYLFFYSFENRYMVCGLFNEACSLASSQIQNLRTSFEPIPEIELSGMMESTGMVFVQSLRELGRYVHHFI